MKIVTDATKNPVAVIASCASYCPSSTTSSLNTVCFNGTNSNQVGLYCFVGDLFSTGQGVIPIMCNIGYYCQVKWMLKKL